MPARASTPVPVRAPARTPTPAMPARASTPVPTLVEPAVELARELAETPAAAALLREGPRGIAELDSPKACEDPCAPDATCAVDGGARVACYPEPTLEAVLGAESAEGAPGLPRRVTDPPVDADACAAATDLTSLTAEETRASLARSVAFVTEALAVLGEGAVSLSLPLNSWITWTLKLLGVADVARSAAGFGLMALLERLGYGTGAPTPCLRTAEVLVLLLREVQFVDQRYDGPRVAEIQKSVVEAVSASPEDTLKISLVFGVVQELQNEASELLLKVQDAMAEKDFAPTARLAAATVRAVVPLYRLVEAIYDAMTRDVDAARAIATSWDAAAHAARVGDLDAALADGRARGAAVGESLRAGLGLVARATTSLENVLILATLQRMRAQSSIRWAGFGAALLVGLGAAVWDARAALASLARVEDVEYVDLSKAEPVPRVGLPAATPAEAAARAAIKVLTGASGRSVYLILAWAARSARFAADIVPEALIRAPLWDIFRQIYRKVFTDTLYPQIRSWMVGISDKVPAVVTNAFLAIAGIVENVFLRAVSLVALQQGLGLVELTSLRVVADSGVRAAQGLRLGWYEKQQTELRAALDMAERLQLGFGLEGLPVIDLRLNPRLAELAKFTTVEDLVERTKAAESVRVEEIIREADAGRTIDTDERTYEQLWRAYRGEAAETVYIGQSPRVLEASVEAVQASTIEDLPRGPPPAVIRQFEAMLARFGAPPAESVAGVIATRMPSIATEAPLSPAVRSELVNGFRDLQSSEVVRDVMRAGIQLPVAAALIMGAARDRNPAAFQATINSLGLQPAIIDDVLPSLGRPTEVRLNLDSGLVTAVEAAAPRPTAITIAADGSLAFDLTAIAQALARVEQGRGIVTGIGMTVGGWGGALAMTPAAVSTGGVLAHAPLWGIAAGTSTGGAIGAAVGALIFPSIPEATSVAVVPAQGVKSWDWAQAMSGGDARTYRAVLGCINLHANLGLPDEWVACTPRGVRAFVSAEDPDAVLAATEGRVTTGVPIDIEVVHADVTVDPSLATGTQRVPAGTEMVLRDGVTGKLTSMGPATNHADTLRVYFVGTGAERPAVAADREAVVVLGDVTSEIPGVVVPEAAASVKSTWDLTTDRTWFGLVAKVAPRSSAVALQAQGAAARYSDPGRDAPKMASPDGIVPLRDVDGVLGAMGLAPAMRDFFPSELVVMLQGMRSGLAAHDTALLGTVFPALANQAVVPERNSVVRVGLLSLFQGLNGYDAMHGLARCALVQVPAPSARQAPWYQLSDIKSAELEGLPAGSMVAPVKTNVGMIYLRGAAWLVADTPVEAALARALKTKAPDAVQKVLDFLDLADPDEALGLQTAIQTYNATLMSDETTGVLPYQFQLNEVPKLRERAFAEGPAAGPVPPETDAAILAETSDLRWAALETNRKILRFAGQYFAEPSLSSIAYSKLQVPWHGIEHAYLLDTVLGHSAAQDLIQATGTYPTRDYGDATGGLDVPLLAFSTFGGETPTSYVGRVARRPTADMDLASRSPTLGEAVYAQAKTGLFASDVNPMIEPVKGVPEATRQLLNRVPRIGVTPNQALVSLRRLVDARQSFRDAGMDPDDSKTRFDALMPSHGYEPERLETLYNEGGLQMDDLLGLGQSLNWKQAYARLEYFMLQRLGGVGEDRLKAVQESRVARDNLLRLARFTTIRPTKTVCGVATPWARRTWLSDPRPTVADRVGQLDAAIGQLVEWRVEAMHRWVNALKRVNAAVEGLPEILEERFLAAWDRMEWATSEADLERLGFEEGLIELLDAASAD